MLSFSDMDRGLYHHHPPTPARIESAEINRSYPASISSNSDTMEPRWISPVIHNPANVSPQNQRSQTLNNPQMDAAQAPVKRLDFEPYPGVMSLNNILNHPKSNTSRPFTGAPSYSTGTDSSKPRVPQSTFDFQIRKDDQSPVPSSSPRVFQCANCHVIFGDSYAQIEVNEDVRILSLSAATMYVKVMDQLRIYQDGPFKSCAYNALQCANCHVPIGSRFVHTTPNFNHIRDYFSFDVSTVVSYRLGPATDVAPQMIANHSPPYESPYPDVPPEAYTLASLKRASDSDSPNNRRCIPPLSPDSDEDPSYYKPNKAGFHYEFEEQVFDKHAAKHRKAQPRRSLQPGTTDTGLYDDPPNNSEFTASMNAYDIQYSTYNTEKFKKVVRKSPDVAPRKKPVQAKAPRSQTASSKSKNWRCAWCMIPGSSTPTKRRGPQGPKTLCNACGLCFSKKGTLPSDRQHWYAQGRASDGETQPMPEKLPAKRRTSEQEGPISKTSRSEDTEMNEETDSFDDELDGSGGETSDSDGHSLDETSAAATIMMLMQPRNTPMETVDEADMPASEAAVGGLCGATAE